MITLKNIALETWTAFECFIEPFLRNLDPSLFQNIILVIFATFIALVVRSFPNVLNSKKQRSEFEKMVLNEVKSNTKKTILYSICGLVVLAFFTGKDISILKKLSVVPLSIFLILTLFSLLWKTFRFSKENQTEFSISLIKKLSFSKFLFNSRSKSEKMINAWKLLWSGKLECKEEEEITKIFIENINNAIYKKEYRIAGSLIEAYKDGIYNRTNFMIRKAMLNQVFEWNEEYLEEKPSLINGKRKKEEWEDNCKALLKEAMKKFLSDEKWQNDFFSFLNDHIQKKGGKKHEHINNLIHACCDVIFDNIENIPGRYLIWIRHLPENWKITMENSNMDAPKIISKLFFGWASSRISNILKRGFDKTLTATIGSLLPYVDRRDFLSFLMLCSCPSIFVAVQDKDHFYATMSLDNELTQEELIDTFNKKKQQRPDQTLDIIFEYFKLYLMLRITNEKNKDLGEYTFDQIGKMKLKQILNDLNSDTIKLWKNGSNDYHHHRVDFINLVESLLKKIETLEQSSSNS